MGSVVLSCTFVGALRFRAERKIDDLAIPDRPVLVRLLLKVLENLGFSCLLHTRPEISHLKALRMRWTHSKFLQRWRILENLQDF